MDDISVSMIVVTLWETFGWLSVIGTVTAVVLLGLLMRAVVRARANGLSAGQLLWQGVVVMLVVAAILTPFVPVWTMAPVGDLRGLVDYVFAFMMAMAPAAIFGVAWVYIRAQRLRPMAA